MSGDELDLDALADAADVGMMYGDAWVRAIRNGTEDMLLPVVARLVAAACEAQSWRAPSDDADEVTLRGDVLRVLMGSEFAGQAGLIRAVVMPVLYKVAAERDAAHAEVAALRERVEALADEWSRSGFEMESDQLRTALTTEADQ